MSHAYLQGVLEVAEVLHLCTKEEITQLCEGQKDDEEHDSKASQVLGTTPQGGRQLGHRLVEADVLEDLHNEDLR